VKKREEILVQCVDDIRAGKVSLEECLHLYPDLRRELEPLVNIAANIQTPSDAHPSEAFKARAKANLMEHIRTNPPRNQTAQASSPRSPWQWWNIAWARGTAIAVTALVTLSASGTGTALAAQSSLPGDNLYSVKLNTEQFQRIVTFDDVAEVELELKFAGIRLDEIEEIVTAPDSRFAVNDDRPEKIYAMSIVYLPVSETRPAAATVSQRLALAMAGYEGSLDRAIAMAEEMTGREKTLEAISRTVIGHLERLDTIEDRAPAVNRDFILDSKDIAISGHLRAIQNLGQTNPDRAGELNDEVMRQRLARAATMQAEGKNTGAALMEYERLRQFGAAISGDDDEPGREAEPNEQSSTPAPTTPPGTTTPGPGQANQGTEQPGQGHETPSVPKPEGQSDTHGGSPMGTVTPPGPGAATAQTDQTIIPDSGSEETPPPVSGNPPETPATTQPGGQGQTKANSGDAPTSGTENTSDRAEKNPN